MKKPKGLLGPDGKPLDVAKYRPKPVTLSVSKAAASFDEEAVTYKVGLDIGSVWRSFVMGTTAAGIVLRDTPTTPPLRSAVESQLAEFDIPEDWQGHEEAPPPPPELTDTYAVAFGSAVRKCPHENSSSTLHARRERQCDDCGRYFTRKEWWER